MRFHMHLHCVSCDMLTCQWRWQAGDSMLNPRANHNPDSDTTSFPSFEQDDTNCNRQTGKICALEFGTCGFSKGPAYCQYLRWSTRHPVASQGTCHGVLLCTGHNFSQCLCLPGHCADSSGICSLSTEQAWFPYQPLGSIGFLVHIWFNPRTWNIHVYSKWLFQCDDESKSLHRKWLFDQTSTLNKLVV